jgi:hypothetical protein
MRSRLVGQKELSLVLSSDPTLISSASRQSDSTPIVIHGLLGMVPYLSFGIVQIFSLQITNNRNDDNAE